jgi:hypothetical protein
VRESYTLPESLIFGKAQVAFLSLADSKIYHKCLNDFNKLITKWLSQDGVSFLQMELWDQ